MSTPAPMPPQPPDQNQTGFSPLRHGNLAQWAAVVVAIVISLGNVGLTFWFHHTEHEATTSDEHANKLINDQLKPAVKDIKDEIDKKLSSINSSLTDLVTRIGKLEGRFEQLDSEQKRLTRLQLDKLSAQISAAQQSKTRIDPNVLVNLGREVIELSGSKESGIARAAWMTTVALANYRSFLNVSQAPTPTGQPSDVYINVRAKRLPGVTWKFGILAYGAGVPRSQAAMFLPLGKELNQPNPELNGPSYIAVEAEGFEVDIDRYHLKNVIIHDARIYYRGDPVILDHVYFVNCTFDVEQSLPGRQFADRVISSTATEFINRGA